MPIWDPSTIAVHQADLRLMLEPQRRAMQRCCLVVYSGPALGRQIQLDAGVVTLGRSAAAHWQVDGPGLSRLHAAIHVTGSRALLRDLEPVNGFSSAPSLLAEQIPIPTRLRWRTARPSRRGWPA